MGDCISKQKPRKREENRDPEMYEEDLNDDYASQLSLDQQAYKIVQLKDMEKQLHRHIGALTFHQGSQKLVGKGTGVLVSPNLVLTCAHNVYNPETEKISKHLKFYPGLCGQLNRPYEIQQLFFPLKYHMSQATSDEYALLKLSRKVDASEFIPLNGNFERSKHMTLGLYGYPEFNYGENHKGSATALQFGGVEEGKIVVFDEQKGEIVHLLEAEKGMDGAPLIKIDEDGKYSIVGIHLGQKKRSLNQMKKMGNSARMITPELINILREEVVKIKADIFTVFEKEKTKEKEKEKEKKSTPKGLTKEQLRQKAEYYQKKREFSQAIKYYKSSIKSGCTSDSIFRKLTKLLQDAGRLQEALEYSKKNIQENQSYKAYYDTGIFMHRLQKYKDAIQNFERAIEINPKYAKSYINLGVSLRYNNQIDEAIKMYHKGLELGPKDSKGWTNLGFAYRSRNEYKESLRCYRTALELNPKYEKTYKQLHSLSKLVEASDLQELVVYLEQLKKKHSNISLLDKCLQKLKQKLKKQIS